MDPDVVEILHAAPVLPQECPRRRLKAQNDKTNEAYTTKLNKHLANQSIWNRTDKLWEKAQRVFFWYRTIKCTTILMRK